MPSADKIQHYCVRSDKVSDVNLNDAVALPNQQQPFVIPAVAVEQNIFEKLMLTVEERDSLESCTRQQPECDKWHDAHCLRITGSKCDCILLQKKGLFHCFSFVYILRSFSAYLNILHGISTMKDKTRICKGHGKKLVIMALKLLGQALWYIQGNAGLELHRMHRLLIQTHKA